MNLRKILILSLPAALASSVLLAALVEAWVRVQWDDRRGTPGFFVADAARGNRLAAGYDGWFAGVPVKTNALGFRDDRDYSAAKPPGTFRILVLGDSVTFGHGALWETTYPYLLEERLKGWRPGVPWQVWNLGVPGYNTSQELAYLREVGSRYVPDLVVVGFYANDLVDNEPPVMPSLPRRTVSGVQRQMQEHLYSFEFYKRTILTARWWLLTSDADRQRLAGLGDQAAMLERREDLAASPEQLLTEVETFDPQQVRDFKCGLKGPGDGGANGVASMVRGSAPQTQAWIAAVRGLQALQRDGVHRIAFFINMAPNVCRLEDRFYDEGALDDDAALREVLGQGTPVTSSTRAFLRYRPSQMPEANGHARGNANRVKADALFEFLRDEVLPPLLPATP